MARSRNAKSGLKSSGVAIINEQGRLRRQSTVKPYLTFGSKCGPIVADRSTIFIPFTYILDSHATTRQNKKGRVRWAKYGIEQTRLRGGSVIKHSPRARVHEYSRATHKSISRMRVSRAFSHLAFVSISRISRKSPRDIARRYLYPETR